MKRTLVIPLNSSKIHGTFWAAMHGVHDFDLRFCFFGDNVNTYHNVLNLWFAKKSMTVPWITPEECKTMKTENVYFGLNRVDKKVVNFLASLGVKETDEVVYLLSPDRRNNVVSLGKARKIAEFRDDFGGKCAQAQWLKDNEMEKFLPEQTDALSVSSMKYDPLSAQFAPHPFIVKVPHAAGGKGMGVFFPENVNEGKEAFSKMLADRASGQGAFSSLKDDVSPPEDEMAKMLVQRFYPGASFYAFFGSSGEPEVMYQCIANNTRYQGSLSAFLSPEKTAKIRDMMNRLRESYKDRYPVSFSCVDVVFDDAGNPKYLEMNMRLPISMCARFFNVAPNGYHMVFSFSYCNPGDSACSFADADPKTIDALLQIENIPKTLAPKGVSAESFLMIYGNKSFYLFLGVSKSSESGIQEIKTFMAGVPQYICNKATEFGLRVTTEDVSNSLKEWENTDAY